MMQPTSQMAYAFAGNSCHPDIMAMHNRLFLVLSP
jgi:hypothetical protein